MRESIKNATQLMVDQIELISVPMKESNKNRHSSADQRARERDWRRSLGKRGSMAAQLEELVERERRQRLIERANDAYARLRADEKAWREWQQELAAWDATLADGLEED
jgi:hypothetical protein